MTLKIEYTSGFNPFEWEGLRCPVCGRNDYVSGDHSSVWCCFCNAKFETRMTAGDPGVVVDCTTEWIHGPKFKCLKCDDEGFASFDKKPKCPKCGEIAIREEGVMRGISKKNKESHYCLILKNGDSCSRWICGEGVDKRLDYPTQKEWTNFFNSLYEFKNAIREEKLCMNQTQMPCP